MKKLTGMATIIGAALAAGALHGCGGGGGGSSIMSTPPPAATFNLQEGIAGLVMNGQTASVALSGTVVNSGTSVPFSGSGTYTLAPGTSTSFNGEGALSQTQSISATVTAAGVSEPISLSVTDYYATGDDAFLGETGSSEYAVAQAPFQYPTTVMVGSSGTLGTTSDYTDSTMSVSQGTTQVSYAVTAVSGSSSSVMVAITNQVEDPQGNALETDVTNYNLTDAGVLTFVSATTQNTSESLQVTAQ
jgi:hypothetical protein